MRKVEDREKKKKEKEKRKKKRENNDIHGGHSNVVYSRPLERRPTGTPHPRAKINDF